MKFVIGQLRFKVVNDRLPDWAPHRSPININAQAMSTASGSENRHYAGNYRMNMWFLGGGWFRLWVNEDTVRNAIWGIVDVDAGVIGRALVEFYGHQVGEHPDGTYYDLSQSSHGVIGPD
jgi:hypothetical protein